MKSIKPPMRGPKRPGGQAVAPLNTPNTALPTGIPKGADPRVGYTTSFKTPRTNFRDQKF